MYTIKSLLLIVILFIGILGCHKPGDLLHNQPPKIEEYVNGLVSPLGVEASDDGMLWVSEAGTGTTSDGKLSVITPGGEVYPVVTGFSSEISAEGGVFGLNHLLLQGDTLFLAHGLDGKLFKLDVSTYSPGDAPLYASDLPYEDIGSFVKAYDFAEDTGDTDLFNLTIGPEGDIYILDAAANAIIHRTTTGEVKMFAEIPAVITTLDNFPTVQAIPTGIVFDGEQFLVSTFTGFPFPSGQAVIYAIDMQGNSSVFQTGLSSMTDLELDNNGKPVVIEYSTWKDNAFAEKAGQMIQATQQKNTSLLTELNFPSSLEKYGTNTYYMAHTFDGVIQKISF